MDCIHGKGGTYWKEKSIYKAEQCANPSCQSVIVRNEITYSHGYYEVRKYSIPTNRTEIGEKALKGYSEKLKARSIEIFETTNEMPSENILGLAIAATYDVASAPFRAFKRGLDEREGEKRRNEMFKELKANYESILDNFDFLNDGNSRHKVKELDLKSCQFFERVFHENALYLGAEGRHLRQQ